MILLPWQIWLGPVLLLLGLMGIVRRIIYFLTGCSWWPPLLLFGALTVIGVVLCRRYWRGNDFIKLTLVISPLAVALAIVHAWATPYFMLILGELDG